MRRTAAVLVATCLLALTGGGSAAADTPGCFGAFVADDAQNPIAGTNLGFGVHIFAKQPGAFGQTWIPTFKAGACG